MRITFKITFLILMLAGIANAQPKVTPFTTGELTVAQYDEAVHGSYFPGFFTSANQSNKPFAIVVTNNRTQPILAIHTEWGWTRANGTQGGKVMENTALGTTGGLIQAGGVVMFLPDGSMIKAMGATQFISGAGTLQGAFPIPAELLSSSQVTLAVDAVVFTDGLIAGPDYTHLVDGMKGQAEAANKILAILNAAKAQGRDPKPDIAALAADRTLPPQTQSHIQRLTRGGTGVPFRTPVPITLPNLHRK